MTKYQSTYRCSDCRHEFSRITTVLPKKEPACPECKKAKRVKFKSAVSDKTHNLDGKNIDRIINSKQAPSSGPSNKTKAIDLTNEIVSQNHGTDFALDEKRKDESMAPKLTPAQQELHGAMFGEKKAKTMPVIDVMERKVKQVPRKAMDTMEKRLVKKINSGALAESNNVVDRVHKAKMSVPTNIVASD